MHDQPTDKSGIQAYNPDEATKKLNDGEQYVASIPFFWLTLRYESQPNVPKYWNRIENLRAHFPRRGAQGAHLMFTRGG